MIKKKNASLNNPINDWGFILKNKLIEILKLKINHKTIINTIYCLKKKSTVPLDFI